MRIASPAAAVDELGAVPVRTSELHARGAHAREREAHALVDVVDGLQERAEVAPGRADHRVVAERKEGGVKKIIIAHGGKRERNTVSDFY